MGRNKNNLKHFLQPGMPKRGHPDGERPESGRGYFVATHLTEVTVYPEKRRKYWTGESRRTSGHVIRHGVPVAEVFDWRACVAASVAGGLVCDRWHDDGAVYVGPMDRLVGVMRAGDSVVVPLDRVGELPEGGAWLVRPFETLAWVWMSP